METVSSLTAVCNTTMALLERKARKVENLECPMQKSSGVTSEATFHYEKKMLWLEAVSGNHPKRAEQV